MTVLVPDILNTGNFFVSKELPGKVSPRNDFLIAARLGISLAKLFQVGRFKFNCNGISSIINLYHPSEAEGLSFE